MAEHADVAGAARRQQRWAIALWVLLAIVVFNVRFDWNTRMAGHAFVRSQIVKRHNGQPLATINDGFRPMVAAAAAGAARWAVLIAAAGTAMTFAATRRRGSAR
jgi:hypothetical protein